MLINTGNAKYTPVPLDFETFYSKDYTLSGRMNTSEYVRDPRFKAHCLGIIPPGAKRPEIWTGDDIARNLKKIDWSTCAVIAHNTAFDGFVLHERYGIHPGLYCDTLSMSRLILGLSHRNDLDTISKMMGSKGKVRHQALFDTKGLETLTPAQLKKLGAYCKDDVWECWQLFKAFYKLTPQSELRLIDITLRMFCDPKCMLDEPLAQSVYDDEVKGKADAQRSAKAKADDLMSNNKFAELLRAAGVEPPTKISERTGKTAYAFSKSDDGFKELLHSPNVKVRRLAEARLKTKSTIGETRATRMLAAGAGKKPIPILLNYAGAHTHRWSGGNKMNMQNLQRGSGLRRSILAPKGYQIVVADYSQVEARMLAWLAGQLDTLAMFESGQDVYKAMASKIYGKPVKDITHDERFIGKIAVLGLGYGMGAEKFHATLRKGLMGPAVDVPMSLCQKAVDAYRAANYRIQQLHKLNDDAIRIMATCAPSAHTRRGPLIFGRFYTQLPNGTRMLYPGLHWDAHLECWLWKTRSGWAKLYGSLATENQVQALCAVVAGDAMIRITDAGYRIVNMTHDEFAALAKTRSAKKCFETMKRIMSDPPAWCAALPLTAEGGWDVCYSK
jgi:DNA polymerase